MNKAATLLKNRLCSKDLIPKLGLVSVLVLIAGLWLSASSASAAPQGITISPPFESVTIAENEIIKEIEISLTNNTQTEVNIHLSSRDFHSLEDGGGVQFLGQSVSDLSKKYSLAPWMTVSPEQIILQPGQAESVTVTIQNNQSLTPGGHYAAVLGQIDGDGTGTGVSVNQVISTLLFVNKMGGEVYGISLGDVSADIQWWGQTDKVVVVFDNQGNTHVLPRGTIKIRGPFGNVLASGVLNQSSSLILPEQSRTFSVNLDNHGLAWWPGQYEISVEYRIDGHTESSIESSSIFLIGLGLPIVVCIIILLMTIGIVVKSRRNRFSKSSNKS